MASLVSYQSLRDLARAFVSPRHRSRPPKSMKVIRLRASSIAAMAMRLVPAGMARAQ